MTPEQWQSIRALTPARVALGRSGGSIPTAAHLRFRADHARARDAVNRDFDVDRIVSELTEAGYGTNAVTSAATSREEYVRRPDLGRVLSAASEASLLAIAADPCDLAIVLCDGLSPRAVERHGPSLADAIASDERLSGCSIGAISVVSNGRVAIGDEIAVVLGAGIVVVLIGERPGLSVSESVGAYLTYEPRHGRTDAERNCVSNIHDLGLSIEDAAGRVVSLAVRARTIGLTGVALKDEDPTDATAIEVAAAVGTTPNREGEVMT